jgi:phosphotransferase system  glucose/maltose/N-acetylglucosamine-specific IIC component
MTMTDHQDQDPNTQGAGFENLNRMPGNKLVVRVIPGLVVFAIIFFFLTLAIGKYGGAALEKKARENERQIQTERMLKKEKEAADSARGN